MSEVPSKIFGSKKKAPWFRVWLLCVKPQRAVKEQEEGEGDNRDLQPEGYIQPEMAFHVNDFCFKSEKS